MHIDEVLKGICHRGWMIKTRHANCVLVDGWLDDKNIIISFFFQIKQSRL